MALFQELNAGIITFSNNSSIASGTPSLLAGNMTTRATLIAEVPKNLAIGSIYTTTTGKIYLKVANTATPADTDWQRVTTTAAD